MPFYFWLSVYYLPRAPILHWGLTLYLWFSTRILPSIRTLGSRGVTRYSSSSTPWQRSSQRSSTMTSSISSLWSANSAQRFILRKPWSLPGNGKGHVKLLIGTQTLLRKVCENQVVVRGVRWCRWLEVRRTLHPKYNYVLQDSSLVFHLPNVGCTIWRFEYSDEILDLFKVQHLKTSFYI